MKSKVNRRHFLKQTSMSMLALTASVTARNLRIPPLRDNFGLTARTELLNLVNEERANAGVGVLKLDELASNVAEQHALDMVRGVFLSHWGRDGSKPYHRYSFAGGTDATEENDSAADHDGPIVADDIAVDPILMHRSMYAERPPNDGHRKTMLAPQHTHVGFGIGAEGNHVRLTELYVARYVMIDRYPIKDRPGSRFIFSGRVLEPRYTLQGIDVCYEPLPSRPNLAWLRVPRPYGLPEDRETLSPKLPDDYHYDDGSKGSIELQAKGIFRVPVVLAKKASGIYTMVVWIQQGDADPFPATQVCVRAE